MLGGVLGLVGFSVLAGVLVTAMVTPAIAVTSMTAQGSIDIFENLPNSIKIGQPSQQNQIFAVRDGAPVLLATIYKQNRVVVGWDDVSPFLKQAAVDGEDRRFFEHGGVDIPSVARAALKTFTDPGNAGGSSTLNMQLVKNILVMNAFTTLTGDEQKKAIAAANGITIDRKLKEMKLAIGLDKTYTKNEILLGYLNIVGMGSTTYGVESAARQYFSVSAKDVSLVQAASLIAIVQQPTSQNLSDPKYYPANKLRRDLILRSMLTKKDITKAQYDEAVATPVESYIKPSTLNNGCRTSADPSAAAACDYATKLITADPVGSAEAAVKADPTNTSLITGLATAKMNKDDKVVPVVDALGATPAERRANWDKGGYKVYLSLDLALQNVAQASLDLQTPATESRFQLGATVNSVEAGTGRILVMAQNKIWDNAYSAGPVTTAAMNFSVDGPYGGGNGYETGSTYKMFDLANWLQIGNGLNDTVNGTGPQTYRLSDFSATCSSGGLAGPSFTLQNDGNAREGLMSVKRALMGSVNNAFMNMAEKQDLCSIRDTAKAMGGHRADFRADLAINPSNILGTNEQAPLTMAGAVATIGAGGLHCAPVIIDKVIDPSGKELPGQTRTCNQALTPEVAAGVADAMIGSMTGGTSRPANPRDGVPIAGKTGTSPSTHQDWVIATTTKIGTSVWTGNWDSANTPLRNFNNPKTRSNYYSSSRFNLAETMMKAMNETAAYKGGDFAPLSSAGTNGSSTSAVPDVIGQTQAQGTRVLTSLQFQVAVGGAEPSTLPAGRITRTNPGAGSNIASGATVTIYTSDGTLGTTMPNVIGMTRPVAIDLVKNAGFDSSNISVVWVKGNVLPNQPDTMCRVKSTSPAAGTAATKTDPVTLTMYGTVDGKDPGPLCVE